MTRWLRFKKRQPKHAAPGGGPPSWLRMLGMTLTSALFLSSSAYAIGDKPPTPIGPIGSKRAPTADDRTFVYENLLPICQFDDQGPIEFTVDVTRYGGPNTAGQLDNLAQLKTRGLIGEYAILEICVWDIDDDATGLVPPDQPERDRVFFNGVDVWTYKDAAGKRLNTEFLTGDHNKWTVNTYKIPIEDLRFPGAKGVGLNGRPTPRQNDIRIDIDVDNQPYDDLWCTAVAWASIKIQIMSPIVLVHGNSQSGAWFGQEGFAGQLDAELMQYDSNLNMVPNATAIAVNAPKVRNHLNRVHNNFGVDSLHVVAHSKGGLDTRRFLQWFERGNRAAAGNAKHAVLSLTTLSTPHDGSILADLAMNNDFVHRVAGNVRYAGFPSWTEQAFDYEGTNGGHPDLQTRSVARWGRANVANIAALPGGIALGAVAADMDNNGSGVIDAAVEYARLTFPWFIWNEAGAADTAYQLLGRTASFRNVWTRHWFWGRVATVTAILNPIFKKNDILVTMDSGHGVGTGYNAQLDPAGTFNMIGFAGAFPGKNHSTVGDGTVATHVAGFIKFVEGRDGDLKP